MGAQIPHIKEIKLTLYKQFDELIPDIIENEETRKQIKNDRLKEIIAKNIRKFSTSKEKEEINQFIDNNFIPQYEKFALRYPIEFFEVISRRIKTFSSNEKKA